MASHHPHDHHQHSHNPIPAAVPSCCSGHYNYCCSQPPPPQLHLSPDPLLETLTLLLQRHQPNHHTYLNKHQARRNHHYNSQFQAQKLHFELLGEDQLTRSLIASLLQRISSLEASLAHFYASSSSNKHSISVREAAARVIQSHFRAYLVRRSRTLSQLQDLAFIKSSFNSLKSSVSNTNHFNYGVISQKAMDLLLKLDSIQGGDPMIRDGKRSISGNVVRFLDFIDALSIRKHGHSNKPVKNVRFVRSRDKSRSSNSNGHFSGPQKELVEKLSERVEKIQEFSRVFDKDEEDVELQGFQEFIIDDGCDEEDENHRVLRNGVLVKSTCGKPRVKKSSERVEKIRRLRVFDKDEEDVELEGFQEFIDDDDNDEEEENHRILMDGKHGNSKIRNGVLVKGTCGKPRVKKTVSFAENGNLYRVCSDPPEPVLNGVGSLSDGSNSSDDHGNHNESEERKDSSEDAENDEVFQEQNGASSNSGNDETVWARNPRREYIEINSCNRDEDGMLVFSPPVPVKMEPRGDLVQKRKAVNIVP